MRIGLYGMPTAGKTYILDKIDFLDVFVGSQLLREYDPEFDKRDEAGREKDRRDVAGIMLSKDNFIMDGHYAFGDEIAFTEEEGNMYDIYLYLYINPEIIKQRMMNSEKNQKYLGYDIEEWQEREITGLRNYCHENNKDFYVVDNPPLNQSEDVDQVVDFIKDIRNGYSCVAFAKKCSEDILAKTDSDKVTLIDGDKSIIEEDSSHVMFGYKTNLYDGNFYTGYQTWKQGKDFAGFRVDAVEIPVTVNDRIVKRLSDPVYIITSGHDGVWEKISKTLGYSFYSGIQMSAETKLYITKYLQAAERTVIAYGDGMNDYYMLKAADEAYLISRKDGSISKSLRKKDLEGITIV